MNYLAARIEAAISSKTQKKLCTVLQHRTWSDALKGYLEQVLNIRLKLTEILKTPLYSFKTKITFRESLNFILHIQELKFSAVHLSWV